MENILLSTKNLRTPAFIVDEDAIEDVLDKIDVIREKSGCKFLFTLKSFTLETLMTKMAGRLNGFSASSLFEANLASSTLNKRGTVHYTSPGLRSDEFEELNKFCDYIVFNSLSQLAHYDITQTKGTKFGLRINPELSFVKEQRYNPCCKNSRLGVPLHIIKKLVEENSSLLTKISGIHFHSNSESAQFEPLLETIFWLEKNIGKLFEKLKWINIGGGYLFNETSNYDPFYKAISFLKDTFGMEVFTEPGMGIIRKSVALVASVTDLFQINGKEFAILDTTVNHMPEVYEYQLKPCVLEEISQGKFTYYLGGASCLAGDVFGEHHFDHPLKIGSRIIFPDMGAYTLVKAHMFNGINLPSIYFLDKTKNLKEIKHYEYRDFLSRVGV